MARSACVSRDASACSVAASCARRCTPVISRIRNTACPAMARPSQSNTAPCAVRTVVAKASPWSLSAWTDFSMAAASVAGSHVSNISGRTRAWPLVISVASPVIAGSLRGSDQMMISCGSAANNKAARSRSARKMSCRAAMSRSRCVLCASSRR